MIAGNRGPAWQDATVALPGGITGGYKISFLASLGTNPTGYILHDFGLDDIEIWNGAVLAEGQLSEDCIILLSEFIYSIHTLI